jgi:hypothetical protein
MRRTFTRRSARDVGGRGARRSEPVQVIDGDAGLGGEARDDAAAAS